MSWNLVWCLQAQRGVEVWKRKWKGSGHCAHFRMYPQEYKEQLVAFCNHSIAKPIGSNKHRDSRVQLLVNVETAGNIVDRVRHRM